MSAQEWVKNIRGEGRRIEERGIERRGERRESRIGRVGTDTEGTKVSLEAGILHRNKKSILVRFVVM